MAMDNKPPKQYLYSIPKIIARFLNNIKIIQQFSLKTIIVQTALYIYFFFFRFSVHLARISAVDPTHCGFRSFALYFTHTVLSFRLEGPLNFCTNANGY